MWTLHKSVITFHICGSLSYFFKHSKNHSDESTDDVDLLHHALYKWVLDCELKLVLFQGGVECHYVCVKTEEICLNSLEELVQAKLGNHSMCFVTVYRKHCLGKHKCTLNQITVLLLLPLSSKLLYFHQNLLDIGQELIFNLLILV